VNLAPFSTSSNYNAAQMKYSQYAIAWDRTSKSGIDPATRPERVLSARNQWLLGSDGLADAF
jgi:hypothetical protein